MHPHLVGGLLASGEHGGLHLFTRLIDHFFDAAGMDAPLTQKESVQLPLLAVAPVSPPLTLVPLDVSALSVPKVVPVAVVTPLSKWTPCGL